MKYVLDRPYTEVGPETQLKNRAEKNYWQTTGFDSERGVTVRVNPDKYKPNSLFINFAG